MNALKTLPAMLLVTMCLSGCAPGVSNRPCPMVTAFPKPLQAQAATEIEGRPAIIEIMRLVSVERAFNSEICR